MAKAAKQVDNEVTEQRWNTALNKVLTHFETIEEARGRFMNVARREREGMTAVYEGLTAFGVSQKSSRTSVKIARALQKIKGWIADLEADDRKQAQRLAKLQGDKLQLGLFGDLPKQERPKRPTRSRPVVVETPEAETAEAA